MMQWIHDWLAGWAWRLGHLTQARGTWLVVALILGIHGLVEATGGVQHAAQWYLTFGLRRTEVVAGALWQVGSYALLHGNWLHALVNGLCVLVLGSRVEYLLGTSGFFKTLAGGVIGGAVGHLVLADGGVGAAPLVGISGACVALLLVLTTLSPDSRMWPIPVSGRNLGRGILLGELVFALINPQLHLPGFFRLGEALVRHGFESWFAVGHACHLAGGVAGWLIARAVLRPRVDLETLRQRRRHREASARGVNPYR